MPTLTLIDSIYKTPEDWRIANEYYFVHKHGAALWIANGVLFCQPEGKGYGLIEAWRAWRAYKWWCKNAPVEAMGARTCQS